jgi:predicted nucleic acid-binding Zn ribbon protein
MNEPVQQKGSDEKYCTECGKPIKVDVEICPHCGVRNRPPKKEKKPNTLLRLVLMFCFFPIAVPYFAIKKDKIAITLFVIGTIFLVILII